MPHISDKTHAHVTEMIKQLLGAWQELTAENTALKEEIFCKDTVALMDECKKYATENFRLKAEIKELKDRRFVRFADDECWIYQGDGTDNLDTLVCPVVIQADVLKHLIVNEREACAERSWNALDRKACPAAWLTISHEAILMIPPTIR